ncbi:MAG: hypothetical protein H7832_05455 [Magnetococcus sp. DMHC-6]
MEKSTALIVLRSEEGRCLIGRGVAALPQVQARRKNGRMVIVGGSTNRHVVWSLLGEDPGLATFAIGWICEGQLGETPTEGRGAGAFLFDQGEVGRGWPGPLLERFTTGDIYIKGANALDSQGNAAILLGSPVGGTIAVALGILRARGGELIVPVSLTKTIPSVAAACGLLGQGAIQRVMGTPVGYMPIMAGSATLVTEVTALKILYQVEATAVAAGGVGDCQGSIVLQIQGSNAHVQEAWNGVLAIREMLTIK